MNTRLNGIEQPLFQGREWVTACRKWKEKYPVVLPRHWQEDGLHANAYAFVDYLSTQLPPRTLTVVSNGTCCVAGHQAYVIKEGTRFLTAMPLPPWAMVCLRPLAVVLPIREERRSA